MHSLSPACAVLPISQSMQVKVLISLPTCFCPVPQVLHTVAPSGDLRPSAQDLQEVFSEYENIDLMTEV